METKELRKNIDLAIKNLLPLFKVTDEELKNFQKYSLTRSSPLGIFSIIYNASCYIPKENKFYFPEKNILSLFGACSSFYWTSPYPIHHEASHYIHRFINKEFPNWISHFEKTKKVLIVANALIELVADYGPHILDLREENILAYQILNEIYERNGPDILPKLARMGLEEFFKSGIAKKDEISELDHQV